MGVPQGWSYDGASLTAPNGNSVATNLIEYLVNREPQWPAGLVPLSDADANGQQLFGLALQTVKENGGIVEVAGSVPPAKTASQSAVEGALVTLAGILTNLNNLAQAAEQSVNALESSLS